MTISATKVSFDEHTMTVELTDGRTLSVPLAWFPRLLHATPAQRAKVELSRKGLHWDHLDEDISISGLLAGRGDITVKSVIPAHAPKQTRLDGRHRDAAGQIRHKTGHTLIGTLRKTYGEHFAKGWRSDARLEELLKKTGAKSLADFRKNYNKRA